MLFRMPVLGPSELAVIKQIEEVMKNFGYAVNSRRWTGNLRRMAFARAVRGSNSIEGYHVTVDDAIAAIEDQEPLRPQDETWLAVMGYRDAMSYVVQLSDDPYFSFSRDLIRGLHFMMMRHEFKKNPGKWRPGPIYVKDEETEETVYEGPQADMVNDLMNELVNMLHETNAAHPFVLAAMAHLNLVMIHPFSDGNGRMARCLQTLVLARGNLLSPHFCSIEEYLGYKQQEYYQVLARVGAGSWHPERDARPWVLFCLTAHFRQASALARWGRIYQKLWDALDTEVSLLGFPDRVLPALSDAAIGFKVRNALYRKQADISDGIAGRDLGALVQAGLLTAHGEKRGRHYMASNRLQSLYKRVHEPYVESDPFESQRYLPGLVPL